MMRWTKTQPTAEGWYWALQGKRKAIVNVRKYAKAPGFWVFDGTNYHMDLDTYDEWSSCPIREPF